MTEKKRLFQIVNGNRISTRSVGDNVTNEDIYDTYCHIPGTRAIIHRIVKAKWQKRHFARH